MVTKLLPVLAAALLVSCTSIFDSYFPDSVEYLENQIPLSSKVGNRPIVSVRMQLLPKSQVHSYDVLVVIVATSDGDQTVLFYDSQLKFRKSYSFAALTAFNGGVSPDLYPISQDSLGLHTGQMQYDATLALTTSEALPTFLVPGSGTTGGGLSQYQSTYFEDPNPALSYPAIFSSGGGIAVSATVGSPPLSALPALTVPTLPGALTGTSLLGVACWNGAYYMTFRANSAVLLAQLFTNTPADLTSAVVAQAQPKNGSFDFNDGWATATAGIVRNHSDNASEMIAFSWSGKELGRLRVGGNNSDLAFAFHPNGSLWYLYDPATGMLSESKAWW